MTKRALITGITGQDGSYLARLLLEKGYEVHGIKRRSSSLNTARIDDIYEDPHVDHRHLFLHFGDLTDGSSITRLVQAIRPDEIYNLGAQSHVQVSFETPEYTFDAVAGGTLRLLEAVRIAGLTAKTRFFQASSSEMFGDVRETPQRETTPFDPQSPYAIAKASAHSTTGLYRKAYGLHASCGIMFNHESPVRGETFVTRKITRAAAAIAAGIEDRLYLGNIDAIRDWGHAREYALGMWLMLQQDEPGDYVLATGVTTSVRQFAQWAFEDAGIPVEFRGEGAEEKAYAIRDGRCLIEIDPRYYRPAEVDMLCGDATRAKETLGWEARIPVRDLVREMVEADMARLRTAAA